MKRIDIVYGGERYSLGGRDFDAVRDEIAEGVAQGGYWFRVNDGEGEARAAYLLLNPGIPIAVVPVPDESLEPDAGPWEEDGIAAPSRPPQVRETASGRRDCG